MINSTRSVGGVHFFSPQRIRWLRSEFDKLPLADDGEELKLLSSTGRGVVVRSFSKSSSPKKSKSASPLAVPASKRAEPKEGRVLLRDFNKLFVQVFGRLPTKTELPTATVRSTDSKNGTVSFDEALRCMTRVAKAWFEIDAETDGKELEAVSEDKKHGAGFATDVLESYQSLADPATGGVSVANLKVLMESAGMTLSEEDIVRMVADVGAECNEDGSIPYPAFVKLLLA